MTNSDPGSKRARRGLIYGIAGSALLAVILWGVISEEAFPLFDSTMVPRGAIWVCPIWLLAGVASLMAVVTGLLALGELSAKGSSAAGCKAWSAVLLGFFDLAALVALVIYFNIRDLWM